MLGRILTAAPHLRGALLQRAHAVDAARDTLERAGVADRCELVVGDFTAAVPGSGDVYLLSRVLHDWDDARCATILRSCAEAMPAHAELLIVERLLPEDDSPSLWPWPGTSTCCATSAGGSGSRPTTVRCWPTPGSS